MMEKVRNDEGEKQCFKLRTIVIWLSYYFVLCLLANSVVTWYVIHSWEIPMVYSEKRLLCNFLNK